VTADAAAPPSNALEARFWAAASAGRVELQRCPSCAALRYFPAAVCPKCLAEGGDWQPLSGRGRLYACTTVERAPSARFAGEVPYTIALIDLDEGPRVMARLDLAEGARPRTGSRVVFAGTGDSGSGPWLRFRAADEP
jgi:uncharacterized OB-fold protein